MPSNTASSSSKRRVLAIGNLLFVGFVGVTGAKQLDPTRFLLGSPDFSTVETTQRYQADIGSTVWRQTRWMLTDKDADRHLQNEITFESACNFLSGAVYGESDGGIVCACTASTLTLRCETPNPVCDELLWTGICASFSMEIVFTEELVPVLSDTCVEFSGNIDPSGPFRDGCVSTSYGSNGTSVDSCTATFDDATGVPTNCTSCRGCTGINNVSGEDVGFTLDCTNIYPGAVTHGCYVSTGTTAEEHHGTTTKEASALFPAVEIASTGGNGTAGNGTSGGGTSNSLGTSGSSARAAVTATVASALAVSTLSSLVWS
jgi:hypothetical protein